MNIDELFKGTKGSWTVPHLSRKDTTCDCAFILSENGEYCGSIATVNWSKDRTIENGDNPPIEEAYYNGRLLGNSKRLLEQCDILASKLTEAINIMSAYTGIDDEEYDEFVTEIGNAYSLINEICDYNAEKTEDQ